MEEHKTPKEKIPGKKFNLKQHKKTIVSGGLVAVIAISGLITGFFIYISIQNGYKEDIFIWGTGGITSLDPLQFDNRENNAILENIVESLFAYEFTSEGTKIIPSLALNGSWSPDKLNFTCSLRQDVKFHDGSPFNATAVKWNFDRIYDLRNHLYWAIWLHPDGTPMLNFTKTRVLDEFTIRFVLNKPFLPFKSILGIRPKIVSPTSTPYDNFTTFEMGNLVGTGPFKYNSSVLEYDSDTKQYTTLNATLLSYDEYWGEAPNFDKIIIKVFDNATLRKEVMLSGGIHATQSIAEDLIDYESAPGINLFNWTSTEINYFSMNNSVINATMRKAISYALDYERLVPLGKGYSPDAVNVIRCRSPLSKGMLYSNWEDFEVPVLNITKARQFLINANWPGTTGLTASDNVSVGNEWERLVYDKTPLASYNFSYLVFWEFHRLAALLFQNNLTQIGININITAVSWSTYWTTLNEHQFAMTGWFPDYNDPNSNMLILSNNSYDNLADIKDTYLQNLIESAVEEFNETMREQLYFEIQEYVIEELHSHIWWYTPEAKYPISSEIDGYNTYNNWGLPWKEWYFTS